ncbi:hypothetical protein O181_084812 [Austropuccinia psidii MF-1]|uniref:NAD(P)-binding protein n=1 Tax=Austropuccinia psidii MF-1 TaxID=1389203 RepID=A0A9Q3IL85_9BASI|nr:hypothetical protein [Austropuccinia psidii MF-1]
MTLRAAQSFRHKKFIKRSYHRLHLLIHKQLSPFAKLITIVASKALLESRKQRQLNLSLAKSIKLIGFQPIQREFCSSSGQTSKMGIFRTESLENANVLVTGASGGIGAATAILFARAGANVLITARRESKLAEVKELAEKANRDGGTNRGGKIHTMALDVQDPKSIESLLDRAPADIKTIDILVNNAGLVYGRDHVGELNFEEVQIMINTNVLGLMRVTNLIVKGMKERNKGHVINIGSIAGREPYAGGSVYCATKHAIKAFSGALIRELVSTPIRVSEVQPGMVETEFSVTRFRGDKQQADAVYQGLKPLVAEDIAEEVVWCAARPSHVNVAELFVLPTAQASATLSHRENSK